MMKTRWQNGSNNNSKSKSNHESNGLTPIEPDKGCKCHSSNGLHHFNCLPDHLRFNQYVHTGYRVDLSTWGCLKSLFYLHNESFNVYSHGLAMIALIILSQYVFGKTSHLRFDPILYSIHYITSTACMLFSSIYHLMLCHNSGKPAYDSLIKLDYFGIWLVTGLSCLTFLKATLFCFPQVHLAVVSIYFLLLCVSFIFAKKTTSQKTRLQSLTIMGVVRGLFIYTTRYIMSILGYTTGPLNTFRYIIGGEMIGVLGGIINVSRLPERWFQGRVDYFFNSHNIMHIVVLFAPVMSHAGTVMDFEWMERVECPT
ncbi:progestin and adipoQ receptor family member 4-like [Dendronephthya gigantea]|uniref:progestin and adipoQ receptor family member 4-like n=1 Tax=Dendronephthya gigantea TaxID=151771 RepID=UPI00106AF146|nr:progestin and adipoQ receptor family member 4-like [Dendronephthya gigantea]